MTCFECKMLMSEYLDNLLSAKERAAFETHLEDCRECREEVSETRTAIQWLQQTDSAIEPPASIRTTVISALQQEKKKHFAPGFKQFVAAAAVFIMLLVGNIFSQSIFHVAALPEFGRPVTMEYHEENLTTNKINAQNETRDVRGGQETVATSEINNLQGAKEPTVTNKYHTLRILFNVILLPFGGFFLWHGCRERRKVLP